MVDAIVSETGWTFWLADKSNSTRLGPSTKAARAGGTVVDDDVDVDESGEEYALVDSVRSSAAEMNPFPPDVLDHGVVEADLFRCLLARDLITRTRADVALGPTGALSTDTFTSPGLLAEDAYDKEAGATTSEGVLLIR